MPTPLSALVVIDYQNMHLTGHDRFCARGSAPHLCLIHPLHFAVQLLLARETGLASNYRPTQLVRVEVFRGLPSNRHQPSSYRRSQAQLSEWTRDRRVSVVYRPLRYPRNWPTEHAQEKGVDVLIALRLVEAARQSDADLIVLASHDTDLEPAADQAQGFGTSIVETAGWHGRKRLRSDAGARWHTFMGEQNFIDCRDTRDYT